MSATLAAEEWQWPPNVLATLSTPVEKVNSAPPATPLGKGQNSHPLSAEEKLQHQHCALLVRIHSHNCSYKTIDDEQRSRKNVQRTSRELWLSLQ